MENRSDEHRSLDEPNNGYRRESVRFLTILSNIVEQDSSSNESVFPEETTSIGSFSASALEESALSTALSESFPIGDLAISNAVINETSKSDDVERTVNILNEQDMVKENLLVVNDKQEEKEAVKFFKKNAATLSEYMTYYQLAIKEGQLSSAESWYTKLKTLQPMLYLDVNYGERAIDLNDEIRVLYLGVEYQIAELRYLKALYNL